jgi:hypothetical protein
MNEEILDPEREQEIALEPLPAFADERDYLEGVGLLPMPGLKQIEDFVRFVSEAKSWYKHLPARPPGAPMYFYLDLNAGRDRLRRWGHRAVFRDRTPDTEQLHYSWMTTAEYRRWFGYLAFCCPEGTGIWMDEMLSDGVAALDCNVSVPLIEGAAGGLLLVPEVVLEAGACLVTRTVHTRTDAGMFWKKWIRADEDVDREPLRGHWPKLADLCEELAREAAGRRFKKLEGELNELIKKQRAEDHSEMKVAIENMLGCVQRGARATN